MCETGKDVDDHYKGSVPVVVFAKRFHHGGIGVPLVVDERGDHFACPEFSVDLSVQTERFLCFQPFSDLGFSQHVFSFLSDGLVVCPRHQVNPDVAGRNTSFPSSLDKSSSY